MSQVKDRKLPSGFIYSQIPGQKLGLCRGCGAFLGYFTVATRNSGFCSPACLIQPLRKSDERTRHFGMLYTEMGLTLGQIGSIYHVSRQSVNHFLSRAHEH